MRGLFVGATLGIVVSCGESGTAPATTVSLAPETVVTAASTDSATLPSTSTSTTTTTTTTLPETTTTVPTEDLIKQAVQDYFAAYTACGQKPATCDPATFTASQGRSRAVVTEFAAGLARKGLQFSPDVRGSYLVAESVSVNSPSAAKAIYCAHDALVVLGPTGPDGLPTVVNDEVLSLRNEYSLYLEGGLWLVGEQIELEQLEGENSCPPAA